MTNKIYTSQFRIKNASQGLVEARIATLEVWDKDNDYTVTGAFGSQENVVLEGWGHDYSLPAGKGRVFERGNEAIFEGEFFLETQVGRENFETVKRIMPEWSYSFRILEATPTTHNGMAGQILKRLETFGVSPVTKGAGFNTATLLLKSNGKRTWLPTWRQDAPTLLEEISNLERRVMQNDIQNMRDELARKAATRADTEETGMLAAWRGQLLSEGHSAEWVDVVIESRINYWQFALASQYYLDPNSPRARALAISMLDNPTRPTTEPW